MLEIERTYLAKRIPSNFDSYPSDEIIDLYIPANTTHAITRIRKSGTKYCITKKIPVNPDDASTQIEHTIKLTQDEFNALSYAHGNILKKTRYQYPCNGLVAEIDIFHDELQGLVVIDFEFEDQQSYNNFVVPEFCLAEITQEPWAAGGVLAGTSYVDIQPHLEKFGYKKLSM